MKDKWMNMGYEEEELKPYVEPEPDYKDLKRIGTCFMLIECMGNSFLLHSLKTLQLLVSLCFW